MSSPRLPNPAALARRLLAKLPGRPQLAVELGSGFAAVAHGIETEQAWHFADLPGFPPTGVSGHDGRLVVGRWHGVRVAILSGRAHYYEGIDLSVATYPIRVVAALGVSTVLFTNAAGGIRRSFRPGDFMALTDHINFIGDNPLRGVAWPGLKRFVDLTAAYDGELRQLLLGAARQQKIRLHQGVYLAVSGPSYETPAEIRAFRQWGADAVGMSTVPGTIVARQCGLRVAAVSCLTNMAAGLAPQSKGIDHEADVIAPAKARAAAAQALIGEFIQRWAATASAPPPAPNPAPAMAESAAT